MDSLFGGLFDFDGDGELDSFEQAAEFGFVMEAMDDEDGEDDDFELDEFEDDEFEDGDGEEEEY